MPTVIGHAASGIALSAFRPASVPSRRTALLCAACACAPDLDAIPFRLGLPYGCWLGHRGFSHSLLFAAGLAFLACAAAQRHARPGKEKFLLWAFFFTSAALHGFLDAMTNGGMGVAFFSPFDTARYFLAWRPIEVSPLSIRGFFSQGGLSVLRNELLWVMVPSGAAFITARLFRKDGKLRA